MTKSVIQVLVGPATFAMLRQLHSPRLETGLTFLPIFAFSVLTGFVVPKIFEKLEKSSCPIGGSRRRLQVVTRHW